MVEYGEAFLKRTIEFWQPKADRTLSLEDARAIAENASELIHYLSALAKKYPDAMTETPSQ